MKNKLMRALTIVLALTLLASCFAGCNNDTPQYEQTGEVQTTSPDETTTAPEEDELAENVNPLTGRATLSDGAIGARPIAIMVENHPSARPQWGLSTPDLIIEGPVEGGITRMMWVYADIEDIPEKVGPVRSSRHDFAEIAAGMNAIYVHWGGSTGANEGKTLAYETIKQLDMDNIDGKVYTNTYFYRDTTRNTAIEHRGYTTQDAITRAISKLGYSTKQTVEDWTPYKMVIDGEHRPWGDQDVTGPCSSITVNFSSSYIYTYKYDAVKGVYYSYINNKIRTDGNTGEEIAFENVLVLYVPVSTLNTKEGHKEWNMELTKGEGFYVSNGIGQRIYWSKAGKDKPLKIMDFGGDELVINNGQTWMGIVPESNRSLTTMAE